MSERNQVSEDNISLSGLGKTMRQFPQAFFWCFSYLSAVFFMCKHMTLIDSAIGLLLCSVYDISRLTFYNVSMVVEFNELSKKTYAEMIDQLNMLASSGSSKKLANELRFSDEAAGIFHVTRFTKD